MITDAQRKHSEEVTKQAKEWWENYKKLRQERYVQSEIIWNKTKFIKPDETLMSYEGFELYINRLFTDHVLGDTNVYKRKYRVNTTNGKCNEITFCIEFEPDSINVKDITLQDNPSSYFLPNERKDKTPNHV